MPMLNWRPKEITECAGPELLFIGRALISAHSLSGEHPLVEAVAVYSGLDELLSMRDTRLTANQARCISSSVRLLRREIQRVTVNANLPI